LGLTGSGLDPMIRRVDSIRALLLETDWSALEHAYSQASETPFHLLALVGNDASARVQAVAHLDAAISHQGTPCSATAPAARVVARLLSDPRTAEPVEDVFAWAPEPRPLRLALLDFLAGVADACRFDIPHQELLAIAYPPDRDEAELQRIDRDRRAAMAELGPDVATRLLVDKVEPPRGLRAAWEDEQYGKAMAARNLLACRQITGELLELVTPLLDDADEQLRAHALRMVVAVRADPARAGAVPALVQRLETVAAASPSMRERATVAIMLGRLGAQPSGLLTDAHPAVRACAALAPAMAADPRATRELSPPWPTRRPPTDGSRSHCLGWTAGSGSPWCRPPSRECGTSPNCCRPRWPWSRSPPPTPSIPTGVRC
jgi:hypothetical protein